MCRLMATGRSAYVMYALYSFRSYLRKPVSFPLRLVVQCVDCEDQAYVLYDSFDVSGDFTQGRER